MMYLILLIHKKRYKQQSNIVRIITESRMSSTNYIHKISKMSYIIPLFKKDDRQEPNNYRGISLLDTLSKIFTAVMSKRLISWAEDLHLILEKQAGFRQG